MISEKRIQTEKRILEAVHEIIANYGFGALGVNRVSKVAIVPKPLIYRYFGSLEALVRTYVSKIDYWTNHMQGEEFIISSQRTELKEKMNFILKQGFNDFFDNYSFQSIILHSITERSKFMRDLSDRREKYNEPIFKNLEDLFNKDKIDVRAISAILMSATYFLVLHARNNGEFCGIDIQTPTGRERITNAISSIVSLMFQ
ncbi:TetR/AcrR family transcriptional regulator [Pedobacter jeongneungensis]|uniref:TetR/AcrR family transcriptional regulator n=1 Tax=Pedobacter jeongneungensis TaxID=947309 RepID=A0ABP8B6Y8_9SPHI